ncbi:MAG: YdeI/OmpD-associated family protein [Nocardioidaceae bacterium]|nr:YdeI/OmpD-associated family protein [Nocardioidaceae bacterium]
MGRLSFATELLPRGNASAIVLTDGQAAEIGEGPKRFPVAVTINGYTWRTTVARMGGENLIGLARRIRDETGLEIGDVVEVAVELDTATREVDVPPELAEALAGDPAAGAAYEGLAYTHRKEFARWVAEAKRAETKERRVAQALEMLHAGRTRS